MRLFVAVSLPDRLTALFQAGAAAVPELRPTAAENLHLTVHFLGPVEAGVLPDLTAAIRDACAHAEPFALRFEEIAPAPPRRPRMLWARAATSPPYAALAEAVAAASMPYAHRAGAARPGSPHVTLARLPGRAQLRTWPDPAPLEEAILEVGACVLQRSQLHPSGSRHTVLERFALGATQPAGRR